GKFHLEADGVNFSGTVDVPDNGSWSNWRWWPTEAPTVYLSAGTHVIRYAIEGNDCNLKDIRFEWRE
ncbi:MAG: carbohydrate-binding protein, partial [Prevotellaceae bacterium]|nr:carbohydrate-binding protein [Prevotellaceae bacterium]